MGYRARGGSGPVRHTEGDSLMSPVVCAPRSMIPLAFKSRATCGAVVGRWDPLGHGTRLMDVRSTDP